MKNVSGIHIYRVDKDGNRDYEFKAVDECPTLQEFYELIDCRLIEIVRILVGDNEYLMVVDEEGLIAKKPVNQAASELSGRVIVGTAVVLDGIEMD